MTLPIAAWIGTNPINATIEHPEITVVIEGAIVNGSVDETLTLEAAEDISGHRAICVKNDGLAYYANANDTSTAGVLGISTNAALAGDIVRLQTSGLITHSGWNFTAGRSVFIADNGALTQTVSGTAYLKHIGTAISATTLFIEVQQTILL